MYRMMLSMLTITITDVPPFTQPRHYQPPTT
jgi:hypothetical protein